ncbi:G2-specific serine/threonine protein kinase [Serendipita sp. 399]|nr:G2-specific serine/threonine protein kinase [Serendipita sp. 399]
MSTAIGFPPSTSLTTRSQFLDAYEAIDIIGNGSFGVIRKVRRKEDSAIYARKELNFERMSDRDKKQIVAEVNILKDLNHENIVRYHDRFVDSENGMLYIVMEYCGGGDLAGVITSTKKRGQYIPEDTVWDYFLQIVLALHHCHAPHIKPGTTNEVLPNAVKRAPILHRDIKPENVFLDANGVVKLGDFGLSKQLGAQAFTNTYVGPSKRPSAAHLLAHERMNLAFKTRETQEMLNKVVSHRQTIQVRAERLDKREADILAKEQGFLEREQALARREQELSVLVATKEAELTATMAAREEELRQWVFTREAELKKEMIAQEEATQQAVAAREVELEQMWNKREGLLRAEIARKDAEIQEREEILKREAEKLHRERVAFTAESNASKQSRKSTGEPKGDATPVRPQNRNSTYLPEAFETPEQPKAASDDGGSAMKGVILGDGQPMPTPVAAQLRQLLTDSPSKRIDLVNVLDRPLPSSLPPSFQGALGDFDEKENSPPEQLEGPPSPSSSSATSSIADQNKTPQAKVRKRTSESRAKTGSTLSGWQAPTNAAEGTESAQPLPAVPSRIQGMQRISSAPVVWNGEEDDDDVPSPFLKRKDRSAVKVASNAPASRPTSSLEKRLSQTGLKQQQQQQETNGSRTSTKATSIKSTTSRTSVGKPISRTVSSKP